jgi:formylglycine-generating enzyme required for sulfatase activity
MKYYNNLAIFALTFCFVSPARAVTFDWATVGNPGNAPDTRYDPAGFGGVDYTYRISKYEVTNAQYTEFLNAVDQTGTNALALYQPLMSSDAMGGINFDGGAANGAKYQIKPGRDKNPVVFVSFFDAMRFVNWLQNGQGSGATESGVYSIGNGANEMRNSHATYFIPSENEWYKAAYHKNDGVTGNYWDYPTSTDIEPYSAQPPGNDAPDPTNTANMFNNDGLPNGYDNGWAVTGSPIFDSSQNYLTDVGAYPLSVSPYGTLDQGGNVWEWNETAEITCESGCRGGPLFWRGTRGGGSSSDDLRASIRGLASAAGGENISIGFRVASIPEPSSVLLAWLAGAGAVALRRRYAYRPGD